ncbi:hypothetical protein BLAT2472_30528 [Burkholderia latens]
MPGAVLLCRPPLVERPGWGLQFSRADARFLSAGLPDRRRPSLSPALLRPHTKIRRQFSVATAKSGCVTRSCKPYIMR